MVGPMVTNPGTRDWSVTASLFATLNDMFGNRTVCGIGRGDSALRVHRPAAGHAGHAVPRPCDVIRDLAEGREVDARRHAGAHPVGARRQAGDLDGRLRAEGAAAGGEQADGFILQSRRPGHRPLDDRLGPRAAAAEAGRDPDASRSASPRPPTSARPRAHARPAALVRRHGRQPRRRPGRPVRRLRRAVPHALTDYIKGRGGLRLRPPRQGRQPVHRLRPRRDRRPVLPARARAAHVDRLQELARSGVDNFAVYLMHDDKEKTLTSYGKDVITHV